MNRKRHIGLLLASCILVAPSAGSAVRDSPQHRDTAVVEAWRFATVDPEIRARRDRILAEIDAGKAGEWAGWYTSHHGETTSTGLLWAPESGYLQYVARDQPSLDDVGYGRVVMDGATLRLLREIQIAKDTTSYNTLFGEFRAVRWGTGRYLIPPERLVRFCDAAASGDRSEAGQFQGIDHGSDWPPTGKPDVPDEYRKYIDAKSIAARVKSMTQTRTEQDVTYDRIVLSAGSDDGVRVEMKFWLRRKREKTGDHLALRVVSVGRDTCETVVESFGTGKFTAPRLGWSFANRLPKER